MAAPGLVLVHSPLLNASSWSPICERLKASGYAVVAPDFTDALSEDPPLYLKIAQRFAQIDAGSGDVVLIAHSGGGALIPVIAAALGPRVCAALFVDALLPHPGRSWFDTVPDDLAAHLRVLSRDGALPPWSEWWPPTVLDALVPDITMRRNFVAQLRPLPLAYCEEKAPDVSMPMAVRCGFLRLSENYEDEASSAEHAGWHVDRMALDHLAILTKPEAVAQQMRKLLELL